MHGAANTPQDKCERRQCLLVQQISYGWGQSVPHVISVALGGIRKVATHHNRDKWISEFLVVHLSVDIDAR